MKRTQFLHFPGHITRWIRLRTLLWGLTLGAFAVPLGVQAAPAKKAPARQSAALSSQEPEPPTPAPPGSSPMADLRQSHTKLQKLISKKSPDWSPEAAARDSEVRKLVSEFLDFNELAKRSLARNWDDLTPAQRTAFVDTLRTLVERSYIQQMHGGANYTLDWEKEILEPTQATVMATLRTTRKGKPMNVALEYKLLHKARGWVVYDVVTDDQSLLETYRAEFSKIIKKESFDALLDRMKKKLDENSQGKKK